MNFIGGALHFLKKRTIPLILQMSQRDFHHHWVGHSLLSADPLRPTIRERRHQRPSPVSPPATWPAHTTTHVILTGRIAAGAAAAARLAREGGDRWPQGRVLLVDSWVSAEPTASARLGLFGFVSYCHIEHKLQLEVQTNLLIIINAQLANN